MYEPSRSQIHHQFRPSNLCRKCLVVWQIAKSFCPKVEYPASAGASLFKENAIGFQAFSTSLLRSLTTTLFGASTIKAIVEQKSGYVNVDVLADLFFSCLTVSEVNLNSFGFTSKQLVMPIRSSIAFNFQWDHMQRECLLAIK